MDDQKGHENVKENNVQQQPQQHDDRADEAKDRMFFDNHSGFWDNISNGTREFYNQNTSGFNSF